MKFDFTNATFSGLLSILAAIYGLAYPLIIQSITRIYSHYKSDLIVSRFVKEPTYKSFKVLLFINLLFAMIIPFLLQNGLDNIFFIILQPSLLVVLIICSYLLFELIIKYGNAEKLFKHIYKGKQETGNKKPINKEDVMVLFDIAIYASSINNTTLFNNVRMNLRQYIKDQQGNDDELRRERLPVKKNSTSEPVKYDEVVNEILWKLKDLIKESNGHNLLSRSGFLVSVLYNPFSSSKISLDTHKLMWHLIYNAITYNNYFWFKSYWGLADNYVHVRKNDNHWYNDNQEFLLRHVMVGTLLLRNERYTWLNYIFGFTHSSPAYYGLIPSTFPKIVDMLQEVDKFRDVFSLFGEKGFYLEEIDGGGVNEEKFASREAVKYLSLLVIRLWSLEHSYMHGKAQDQFQKPKYVPKSIEEDERIIELMNKMIELMNKMIDDIDYFYSNNIFSMIPRLKYVEKDRVIKLLTDYRDECE